MLMCQRTESLVFRKVFRGGAMSGLMSGALTRVLGVVSEPACVQPVTGSWSVPFPLAETAPDVVDLLPGHGLAGKNPPHSVHRLSRTHK